MQLVSLNLDNIDRKCHENEFRFIRITRSDSIRSTPSTAKDLDVMIELYFRLQQVVSDVPVTGY